MTNERKANSIEGSESSSENKIAQANCNFTIKTHGQTFQQSQTFLYISLHIFVQRNQFEQKSWEAGQSVLWINGKLTERKIKLYFIA